MSLLRGDCFSRREALSSMRGCRSYRGVVGSSSTTSFSVRGPSGSGTGDRVNTGGDLVTSLLVVADKLMGVNLFVGIDPPVRPMVGVGEKTLEAAGKKLS